MKASAILNQRNGRIPLLLGCFTALVAALSLSNAQADDRSEATQAVFIPHSDLEAVLKRDKQGVMLPKAELLELLDRVEQNRKRFPAGHQLGFSQAVNVSGEWIDGHLLLELTARFRQFDHGWQQLKFPMSGVSVESARLDTEPAHLGRHNGHLVVLSQTPGEHTLTMKLSVPTNRVGSDRVAGFQLPSDLPGELEVKIPDNERLLLNGLQLQPVEPALYRIAFGGLQNIQLRRTAQRDAVQTDTLVFADTAIGLQVAPGELGWTASTVLQVHGQAVDQLDFHVPNSLEVAQVDATGLESWELADDPELKQRTQIRLRFRQPIQGRRVVQFRGITTTTVSEPWAVPNLVLKNATAQTGRIVIRYPKGVRLLLQNSEGVRQTVAGQASGAVRRSVVLPDSSQSFDIWSADFQLEFITQTKQRELQVNVTTTLEVEDSGVEMESVVSLQPLYAPLFHVDLEVPAEWRFESVTESGNPVPWRLSSQEAGTNLVRIDLPNTVDPGATVALTIGLHRDLENWPDQETEAAFEIPNLTLTDSNVTEGILMVKAPEEIEVVPVDLEGLEPTFLGLEGERAGFRFQDAEFQGTLQVKRLDSLLTATTLSSARIDPDSLRVRVEADVKIEGGGLMSIELQLPESVGDDVRFQLYSDSSGGLVRIAEQQVSAATEGVKTWRIKFDQRLLGSVGLWASIEIPRAGDGPFAIPIVTFPNAPRQNGAVAVEASFEQLLEITAVDDAGLELGQLDPADLDPFRSGYQPKERIVAAYRYVAPGPQLEVSVQKLPQVAVPTAICDRLAITTVLGRSGQVHHQARLLLRATGVQGLIVKLPDASTLWATLVDGQPIEVQQVDANHVKIPLSSQTEVDTDRTLDLFYETNSESALTGRGQLTEDAPGFVVELGDGNTDELVILNREWELEYPAELYLLGSRGLYAPDSPLEAVSFLGEVTSNLQPGNWDRLGQHGLLLGSIAFGIGVLTVLLRWVIRQVMSVRLKQITNQRMLLSGCLVVLLGACLLSMLAPRFLPRSSNQSVVSFGGADAAKRELKTSARYDTANKLDQALPQAADGGMEGDFELFDRVLPAEKPGSQAGGVSGIADPFGAQPPPTDEAEEAAGSQPDSNETDLLHRSVPPANRPASDDDEMANLYAQQDRLGDELQAMAGRKPLGGRLSVAMHLPQPESMRSHTFRYVGNTLDPESALSVDYENSEAASLLRLAVATGVVVLLFVFLRRRPWSTRLVLAVVGIAAPMALVTLVPSRWNTLLDGVFLGTVASLGLWFLAAFCGVISSWCRCCWQACCGAATTTAVLCVLLSGSTAHCQPPAGQPAADAAGPLRIYLPYSPGENPLTADKVFLPYQDFRRLWNQAHPDQPIEPQGGIRGLLSAAAYSAELETIGDQARVIVRGRLVLHNHTESAQQFVLPFWNVGLEQAQLNGQAAVIRTIQMPEPLPAGSAPSPSGQPAANAPAQPPTQSAQNPQAPNPAGQAARQAAPAQPAAKLVSRMAAVIEGTGTHVLDVVFSVPANTTGPAGQFRVQFDSVPAAVLNFKLPEPGLDVLVNQQSNLHRLSRDAESSSIDIAVDQGGLTSVSWQPPESDNVMDTIVHATSSTSYVATDPGLQITADFVYSVRQGSVTEVRFELPDDLRIEQIAGEDVGGWEPSESDGKLELKVFLRRNVDDQTHVQLKLFQPLEIPSEQELVVDTPAVVPLRITRETGVAGFFAAPHLDARTKASTGIRQIGVSAYQPVAQVKKPTQTGISAFEFNVRPWTVGFALKRRQPTIAAQAQHAAFVQLHKINLTSLVDVELRGAPRSRLVFRLPLDFIPLTVHADNLADWFVTEEGFDTLLVLELASARTGDLRAVIQGAVPRDAEDEFCEVDTPLLLGAEKLQSKLAVWFDETYAAQIDEIESWQTLPINGLSNETRKLRPDEADFAFQSTATDTFPASFTLNRRQAFLTGEVVTVAFVFENSVEIAINFNWAIRNAPADRFVFTTPDTLQDRLRFRSPGIRQVLSEEIAGGRLRWTIVTREPQRESFYAVAWVLRPAPGRGENPQVSTPAVELERADAAADTGFSPLDTQRHFVLLDNRSPYELMLADGERVVAADRDEIQMTLPDEDSLFAGATTVSRLRDRSQPAVWDVQLRAATKATPATVNLAEILTVIEHDGSWKTQCKYRTRNRTRQFLPIRLPEGASILSAIVAGQPVRPVRTEVEIGEQQVSVQLVAIPKTSEADLPFEVRVVTIGQLDVTGAANGWNMEGKPVAIPVPTVVPLQDNEQFGIPVMKVAWDVYVPESWDASVVTNTADTNVTLDPATVRKEKVGPSYYGKLAYLKELNLISDNAESSASSRQLFRARGNFKVGYEQLRSQKWYVDALNERDPGQASELAAEIQKLESNRERLLSEAQAQQARQAASATAAPSQVLNLEEQVNVVEGFNEFVISNNATSSVQIEQNDKLFNYDISGNKPNSQAPSTPEPATSKSGAPSQQSELRNSRGGFAKNLNQLKQQNKKSLEKGKGVRLDIAPNQAGQGAMPAPVTSPVTGTVVIDGVISNNTAPGFGELGGNQVTNSNSLGVGGGGFGGMQSFVVAAEDREMAQTDLAGIVPGVARSQMAAQGLSLDMEIPVHGKRLTLTKVGGSPQLTLSVRPATVRRSSVGWIWSAVWIVVGLVLLSGLRRHGAAGTGRGLSLALILVGITCTLALPTPENAAGVVLFTLGCVVFACFRLKDSVQQT